MTSSSPALAAVGAVALLLSTLAFADGSRSVALDREQPLRTPPGVVDAQTARALVGAGAVVVDVRTPREFEAGHVPGALNIPYDQIRSRSAEIGGPDTPVLLYCQTGRRSAIAADALRDLGFERLWDLQSFARWNGGDDAPPRRQ